MNKVGFIVCVFFFAVEYQKFYLLARILPFCLGALFLMDLTSTYGTYVNKKRINANEFVRLHIGDVVVFGESTRLYAVGGPQELLPEEYESTNLKKYRDRVRAIPASKKNPFDLGELNGVCLDETHTHTHSWKRSATPRNNSTKRRPLALPGALERTPWKKATTKTTTRKNGTKTPSPRRKNCPITCATYAILMF